MNDAAHKILGIRRLAVVTPDRLWRGGRVNGKGLTALAALGCRRSIDLTRRERGAERRACDRLGLAYRKVPLDDHAAPDATLLAELVADLRDGPPTLVHCWGGRHRVGLVIAAYRVVVEGWTAEDARAEMRAFGFGDPAARPGLWDALPCR